jgi:hypothetical protein
VEDLAPFSFAAFFGFPVLAINFPPPWKMTERLATSPGHLERPCLCTTRFAGESLQKKNIFQISHVLVRFDDCVKGFARAPKTLNPNKNYH